MLENEKTARPCVRYKLIVLDCQLALDGLRLKLRIYLDGLLGDQGMLWRGERNLDSPAHVNIV